MMDATELREAIAVIPAGDRETWVRVAMAVKSAERQLNGEAFEIWDAWSQTADNYDEQSAKEVWKSIETDGGITIKTLFSIAKDHGYRPPKHEQALTPQELWDRGTEAAAASHFYVLQKGIRPHGTRADGDTLLIPVRTLDGDLVSVQSLYRDRSSGEVQKRFFRGAHLGDGCFVIGTLPADVILIAEGFATGASLAECTGHTVVVAFDSGRLPRIARAVRGKYPDPTILICGDDDRHLAVNAGAIKAHKAADAVGGRWVLPKFTTGSGTDFDDLRRTEGADAVRAQIAEALVPDEIAGLDGWDPGEPPPLEESQPGATTRRQEKEDATTVIVNGRGISMSEDAIALAFADTFYGRLLYNHTARRWHHWNGAVWRREETRLAYEWARQLTRELNTDGKARWARSAVFSSVETIASADRAFAKTVHDFDRDPWLLGTPGGTVDLRTGVLSPPDPASLITRATGFAPADHGAVPHRWLAFLDEVTRSDAELIRFLQKVCGYALTGRTTEHLLVFIYGTGGNGKGVLLSVLNAVFGDYAQAAAMETFTASKYDRHPTEIAALAGARLVTAQETESGRAWAESRIKALTGGDRIRARFMRCDEFEFTPEFQLIVAGNHKPRIQSVDDAMRRRLALINFPHKPKTVNTRLVDELLTEGPAILRWMLDGCIAWQSEGLDRPASVVAATDLYFDEEDRVAAWIDECCEISSRYFEPSGLLFASWTAYCKANGEEPHNGTWFGTEMNRKGFYVDRSRSGRPRMGLRVKPPESDGTAEWWGR